MNLFVTFNPESDCNFSPHRVTSVKSVFGVRFKTCQYSVPAKRQCYISEQILSTSARTEEGEKVNALANNL